VAAEKTRNGEQLRYSQRHFPAYRFIPGQRPHPRRDPRGHSYGLSDPKPGVFRPEQWRASEDYRYAVDLYNFGYWWESHEVFEGLWCAVGKTSEQGNFFQALIDLAAANLKLTTGASASAQKLWESGLRRLDKLPSPYMGLDIRDLEHQLRSRLTDFSLPPVLLRLQP
jgi:hypothetical protein